MDFVYKKYKLNFNVLTAFAQCSYEFLYFFLVEKLTLVLVCLR